MSNSSIRPEHYVMVDDKLRISQAMKEIWGDRLTTNLPATGHYALDPGNIAAYPRADITIEHIGEIVNLDSTSFLAANEGDEKFLASPAVIKELPMSLRQIRGERP